MLILSSCSLLEKKPTPEKEQVDQEDTQDIQAKTTGENPTSPLPWLPTSPQEDRFQQLLNTLSPEEQTALQETMMQQQEVVATLSLERFLSTLRTEVEKETDANKKWALEDTISAFQSLDTKRAQVNTLGEKAESLQQELQSLASQQSSEEEMSEEDTKKSEELYASLMEIQQEYVTILQEAERTFGLLSPEHLQLMEEYFVEDFIAGVIQAQPNIDAQLIEELIRSAYEEESEDVPEIQELPPQNPEELPKSPQEDN